ncbi:MAG: DUF29 family protein, partial [Candidatus Binataceae bacterium]
MAAAPKIQRQLQKELNPGQTGVAVPSALQEYSAVVAAGWIPPLYNGLLWYHPVYLTSAAAVYPNVQVELIGAANDFHGWCVQEARLLHDRQASLLDWDSLAEELETMAAAEKRELRKRLRNLLFHLLKWR